MPDWPNLNGSGTRSIVSTYGPECIGGELSFGDLATSETTAWPSANLGQYLPFTINQVQTIYYIRCQNGGAVAGTIDVGIYDADGNRIVTMGATTMAGTSAVQDFNIPDTVLQPGVYYMAMSMSDTATARVRGWPMTAGANTSASGCLQQASVATLPSPTATFAASTSTFVPLMALMGRAGA